MLWDIILLLSLIWVSLRLYQLSKISREILEERLGYDIPPAPEISIAAVHARSILLYWLNGADSNFLGATMSIICNGIKLGCVSPGDTKINISPLNPDCHYSLKVISRTSTSICTASSPVLVQTLPECDPSAVYDESEEKVPKVLAGALPDSSQNTSILPREGPAASQQLQKQGCAHTSTSTNQDNGTEHDHPELFTSYREEQMCPEKSVGLLHRCETLKNQKEDIDRQIDDEDSEAKSYQRELLLERDDLRHELKEKESSSAELRKHGNQLDKLNRSAQSRRMAIERSLQRRRAELQKLRNEAERLTSERITTRSNVEQLVYAMKAFKHTTNEELTGTKCRINAEQNAVKAVEDEVRMRSAQIKDIELRKDDTNDTLVAHTTGIHASEDKDSSWGPKLQSLQIQINSMLTLLQQLKTEERETTNYVQWLTSITVQPYANNHAPNYTGNLPAMHRSRLQGPAKARWPASTQSTPGNYGGSSTQFTALTPYAPSPALQMIQEPNHLPLISDSDETTSRQAEYLAQGRMSSPAADELLPSDLFGEDDPVFRAFVRGKSAEQGSETHTACTNPKIDGPARGFQTPISAGSQAGSLFASPHASQQNVSSFTIDSERQQSDSLSTIPMNDQSISRHAPNGGKFANFFSSPFGWQRVRSTRDNPALGTLSQSQSQSFPKITGQETADTSAMRRRRGSHGTWTKPVVGLLGRGGESFHTKADSISTGLRLSNGMNALRRRMDAPDSSEFGDQGFNISRPSSTYSFDHAVGRLSSDSQHVWSSVGDQIHNRSSPLNVNWTSSSSPWSRDVSRRASVQHGSSTNLSVGTTPLKAEDVHQSLLKHRSEQAPIGTRRSAPPTATPKLNPAAPSFKTLFGRSEAKKTAKAEKSNIRHDEALNGLESGGMGENSSLQLEEPSPSGSRLSRDAQSVSTTASTAGSFDSVDGTTASPHQENTMPKESLMQKITRKSSSSKFNVPWSKEKGLFSKRAGEPSNSGEFDEDTSSEGNQGKTNDSTPNTPREEKPGRAWPSLRRKSKKGTDLVEEERSVRGDEG